MSLTQASYFQLNFLRLRFSTNRVTTLNALLCLSKLNTFYLLRNRKNLQLTIQTSLIRSPANVTSSVFDPNFLQYQFFLPTSAERQYKTKKKLY